ncbi:tRNA (guanosine(46)-N7)-methyltransferase TrmB [Candidatus Regiella endosymbiont of Tuberolachnus salignus]
MQANENSRTLRPIRSFVRRQGRLTKGQQLALDNYWPSMGLDYQSTPINLETLFAQAAPLTLEIGFGMGASLVAMAANAPQQNFLGIEVHLPGVGACLATATASKLTNLRLICHDALEVLTNMLPDDSLDKLQLFFPDPWHKLRHNKRRIVQPPFVELVKKKLKIEGIFHMATDWQPYAKHMLAVMSAAKGYHNLSSHNDYVPRPDSRPITKFESRGQRLGHGVWDLMFVRQE